ncbi:hypothetical protein DERP_005004 [Dermatophagoides pteronyssinus]|uniref:Uncharacterized protein n=1 Tax=Dermatophagoides pteronyssinus TaxID=6956 RepID=A0ABQ8JU16_DERPT|nr:hypothetical protein DERP_005004 [Dermatophagoides pteronyssinus]
MTSIWLLKNTTVMAIYRNLVKTRHSSWLIGGIESKSDCMMNRFDWLNYSFIDHHHSNRCIKVSIFICETRVDHHLSIYTR